MGITSDVPSTLFNDAHLKQGIAADLDLAQGVHCPLPPSLQQHIHAMQTEVSRLLGELQVENRRLNSLLSNSPPLPGELLVGSFNESVNCNCPPPRAPSVHPFQLPPEDPPPLSPQCTAASVRPLAPPRAFVQSLTRSGITHISSLNSQSDSQKACNPTRQTRAPLRRSLRGISMSSSGFRSSPSNAGDDAGVPTRTPKDKLLNLLKGKTGRSCIFADTEQLKEQIQQHLTEDQFDITMYYRKTGFCQAVARNPVFENVSLLVVAISSIWIGVDIDLDNSVVLWEAAPVFQVMAHSFCVFFCGELLIRVSAFEDKRNCLKVPPLMFDALLVVFTVLETWVFALVAHATSEKPQTGNMRFFVVFRVMRLLRTLRLGRVVRALPELMVIVRGISIASRAIVIVLMLLVVVIYVFAICFTVLFDGTPLGAARFSRIGHSMGTLLLDGTLSGSKGAPVIREAYEEHPLYAVAFIAFVLLSNVTIMGVLAGMLVQTVKTVAEVEREEAYVSKTTDVMNDLWEKAIGYDIDGDRSIDEEELTALIADKDVARILSKIGVDLEGLVNVSGFIFQQHEGKLSRPQFKRMILGLRGKQVAKVKDHVETRKFMHAMLQYGHHPPAEAREGCEVGPLGKGRSSIDCGLTPLPFVSFSARPSEGLDLTHVNSRESLEP